jgi:tryptophan synthase alpha chain
MNPIDSLFQQLKQTRQKAFMPFIPAGDPNLAVTQKLLIELPKVGADIIELGFPFSDPIADGSVIAASYTRALDQGLKLDQIFEMVRGIPKPNAPIVGMVSYSLILRYGAEKFLNACVVAGFSGAVLPDLPGDEAEALVAMARERDFKTIFLVTPTTTPSRAEKIISQCTGFVYCVSVVGITGERDRLPEQLGTQLSQLRTMTDLPLCVGFGVSRPEHVEHLRPIADGIIVGSALVKFLEKHATNPVESEAGILNLATQLAASTHAVS